MRDRSLAGHLVPEVPDSEVLTLTGDEGRHAAAVRRVRAGERLMVTDGRGTWAVGEVVGVVGRDTVELQVLDRGWEPAPLPSVTVVQALPKGERGPLAVELLTEVGVDRIVPWQARRCVSRWSDGAQGADRKAHKSQQRWQRVAQEAAKQSRRVWVPEVAALTDTADVAQMCRSASLALICHEMAMQPLTAVLDDALGVDGDRAGTNIVIVIGPEGSLTDEETETLESAGGQLAGMGPTVMRTSSAGAVAAAVVMARSGRWRETSSATPSPDGP